MFSSFKHSKTKLSAWPLRTMKQVYLLAPGSEGLCVHTCQSTSIPGSRITLLVEQADVCLYITIGP